jgi:hypothetical protein
VSITLLLDPSGIEDGVTTQDIAQLTWIRILALPDTLLARNSTESTQEWSSVNISCREIVGLGVCIRPPQLKILRDIANKVLSQQIVAMNIPEVQEEAVGVEEVSAVIKTDLAPFQATIDLVAAAATVRS